MLEKTLMRGQQNLKSWYHANGQSSPVNSHSMQMHLLSRFVNKSIQHDYLWLATLPPWKMALWVVTFVLPGISDSLNCGPHCVSGFLSTNAARKKLLIRRVLVPNVRVNGESDFPFVGGRRGSPDSSRALKERVVQDDLKRFLRHPWEV